MTHFLSSFLWIHHYFRFFSGINANANNPLSVLQAGSLEEELLVAASVKFGVDDQLPLERVQVFIWMLALKFAFYLAVPLRVQSCMRIYFIQFFSLTSLFQIFFSVEWRRFNKTIAFVWTGQKRKISCKCLFIFAFNNITNFKFTWIYLDKSSIFKYLNSLTILSYNLRINMIK